LVGEGSIISGSVIRGSVIGRNVRVHSYCLIEDAIVLDWVEISRGCRIRRAILDKHNVIPPGTEIGYDRDRDRENYFLADGDIVVVPRSELKTTWMLQNP
jgi:glucose-1-phosphate adenylyltransferase